MCRCARTSYAARSRSSGSALDGVETDMSESSAASPATVAARVEAVIRDVLGLETDSVLGSSRLREDLGADSVDAVMLVMALEKEFSGQIPDDEYVGLSTVDEVVALITKHAPRQGLS